MTLFSPFPVLGTPFLIAIQLKPYFASIALTLATYLPKIVRSTTLLGTADFLVHHITTCFTLHTALLVLLKVLYLKVF